MVVGRTITVEMVGKGQVSMHQLRFTVSNYGEILTYDVKLISHSC